MRFREQFSLCGIYSISDFDVFFLKALFWDTDAPAVLFVEFQIPYIQVTVEICGCKSGLSSEDSGS